MSNIEGPPENNLGKYRIPGDKQEPVAESPVLTSKALEEFKAMRMECNKILAQNREFFRELHTLSPGGSLTDPQALAVIMMLAKRFAGADTEVYADKK